jgi:nicotinamide mononucleotide (NMN) deamidase PncC
VPGGLIDNHGPISSQAATAMADGVRTLLGAELGLAVTGTPEAADQVPAGTIIVALSADGGSSTRDFSFEVEPDRFRRLSAYVALGTLRRSIVELG